MKAGCYSEDRNVNLLKTNMPPPPLPPPKKNPSYGCAVVMVCHITIHSQIVQESASSQDKDALSWLGSRLGSPVI